MRRSRLLALLLGPLLLGAGPVGDSFHRLDRGRVTQARLNPPVHKVAVYYGASWCGPCRAFVPELIAVYPRLRQQGMEVLFVSDDASCTAALDYARTSRMPWLLLPCDAPRRQRLRALGGQALPGLVVLDRNGRQMATSWRADGTSTPRQALAALLDR